jgi:hypothetical protein
MEESIGVEGTISTRNVLICSDRRNRIKGMIDVYAIWPIAAHLPS